jgi:hypothetical protein
VANNFVQILEHWCSGGPGKRLPGEMAVDYDAVQTYQMGFLFQVGKWMEFGIHLLSLMAENIFLDREECRVAVR